MLALNGILAVVDAEQFPQLRGEDMELARLQLEAADLVVLKYIGTQINRVSCGMNIGEHCWKEFVAIL